MPAQLELRLKIESLNDYLTAILCTNISIKRKEALIFNPTGDGHLFVVLTN